MISLLINNREVSADFIKCDIVHSDDCSIEADVITLHNVKYGDTVQILTHMGNDYGSLLFDIVEIDSSGVFINLKGRLRVSSIINNEEYINNLDIFGGPVPDLLWTIRDPGYRLTNRELSIRTHPYLEEYSSILSVDSGVKISQLIDEIIPVGYTKTFSGDYVYVRPRRGVRVISKDIETIGILEQKNVLTNTGSGVIYKLIYNDKSNINSSSSLVAYFDPDSRYPNLTNTTISTDSSIKYLTDSPDKYSNKEIVEIDITERIGTATFFTPRIFDPVYRMNEDERKAFFRPIENQENEVGGFHSDKEYRYIRRAMMIYYFGNYMYKHIRKNPKINVSYSGTNFGVLFETASVYSGELYLNNKSLGTISSITYDLVNRKISNMDVVPGGSIDMVPPTYKQDAWVKYKEDPSAPNIITKDVEGNDIYVPVYQSFKKNIYR